MLVQGVQNSYTLGTTDTLELLEMYLKYLHSENKSIATINNRRYILYPLLKHLPRDIQQINRIHIDDYLIHRAHDIKQSSLGLYRQAIRSFFGYCQVNRMIETQVDFRSIKRTKQPQGEIEVFTLQQIRYVIDGCTQTQDKLIIALMFETGMRIGEVIRLEFEHMIHTQIRVIGKGGRSRSVFITSELYESIIEYCQSKGYSTGCVFRPLQQQKDNRYISTYGVRDRIEAAFKRRGLIMHPHLLRHSFAAHWVKNGGDLRSLQLLLGHTSLEITQQYLRFGDKRLQMNYTDVMRNPMKICLT